MQALPSQSTFYRVSRTFWRRFTPWTLLDRWALLVTGAVAIGMLVGWLVFKFTPPTATASVDLFITARLSPSSSFETEAILLGSQSNIEQALELVEFRNQPEQIRMSQTARESIRRGVKVEKIAEDVARLSVTSPSGKLSTLIANELVERYRESVIRRAGATNEQRATEVRYSPEVLANSLHLSSRNWLNRLLQGALWGFGLAIGFVLLFELTDARFRNPDEIAEHLGVPVAGHIPSFQRMASGENDDALVAIRHARGRSNEAYRSVRTWLSFHESFAHKQILQITSPLVGDGKSTLAANLAINMARSGKRVLLLDGDLRRPQIARLFQIDSEVGIETLLAGFSTMNETIAATDTKGLFVLPVVRRPANPAELLASEAFAQLLDELRQSFDYVIIDSPALLACCDASVIAGLADGVLVSLRLTRRTKHHAARAFELLRSVHANALGVVVNGQTPNFDNGYTSWQPGYAHTLRAGSVHVNATASVDDQASTTADT